jgi:hypothetical protein
MVVGAHRMRPQSPGTNQQFTNGHDRPPPKTTLDRGKFQPDEIDRSIAANFNQTELIGRSRESWWAQALRPYELHTLIVGIGYGNNGFGYD